MLREVFESAGSMPPAELRVAYDERLAETITDVGIETVAQSTELDTDTLSAIVEGDRPELTLKDAAAILACDENLPDADALEAEARDILLMGMSIAVLDVEAVASGINDEMEPKEIQQKAEGRYPITLDEYAVLHSFIESEKQ